MDNKAYEKEINIIADLSERKRSPVKAADILELGISYNKLTELQSLGIISRIKNGYYALKDAVFSEEELAIGLFEDGVFTMDTALFYHGYIERRPQVWSIAVSKNTSKSRFKLDFPKLKAYYTKPEVLEMGLETGISKDGNEYRIYSKDRLVCEVLKYEERLDYDTFQEALKKYVADENKNVNKLVQYAKERKVYKKLQDLILPWLPKGAIEIPLPHSSQNLSIKEDNKTTNNKEIISEKDIAEAIFSLSKGETPKGLYEAISSKSLNGVKVWNVLKELFKDANMVPDLSGLNNLTESEEGKYILKFITPIFISIISDEVFLGDWMPELGRYL